MVARLLIVVLGLVGACDLAGDAQGNPAGPSLALLGDSITVRATPSLHTALDPEYRVRLGAEVGMTFADMQETARTLGADGPAIVVVALGTNDVWNGVPTEESTAQLDLLLGNFPTACRVLVNVSDQVGVLEKPYDNGLASALNVVIADRADVVVDWNAAANADPGTYLGLDAIHPLPAGEDLLASMVHEATRSACPVPTSTTVAADPSVGTDLVLRATVSAPSGTPWGDVTFVVDGAPLGSVPIEAGAATLAVPGLAPGDHEIRATSGGTAVFAPSESPPVTVTVSPPEVTTTVEMTTTVDLPPTTDPDPTTTIDPTAAPDLGSWPR